MSPVAAERASAASAAALSCCEPPEAVDPEAPDLLPLPQPLCASAPVSRAASAMPEGRLGMAGPCHSEPECLLNDLTRRPAVAERRKRHARCQRALAAQTPAPETNAAFSEGRPAGVRLGPVAAS